MTTEEKELMESVKLIREGLNKCNGSGYVDKKALEPLLQLAESVFSSGGWPRAKWSANTAGRVISGTRYSQGYNKALTDCRLAAAKEKFELESDFNEERELAGIKEEQTQKEIEALKVKIANHDDTLDAIKKSSEHVESALRQENARLQTKIARLEFKLGKLPTGREIFEFLSYEYFPKYVIDDEIDVDKLSAAIHQRIQEAING